MNSDAPSQWPASGLAERRVLEHQLKLYRWASTDRERRFADVFNLIYDRATLVVAWDRVAGNRGAQTAGVDAVTRFYVEGFIGVISFLEDLRSSLKDGSFTPLPVKHAVIPKKGGKVRLLGVPTLRDRVAQMALKLILETICEVDFYPSSYGYRLGRRAQDAIAEIHHFISTRPDHDFGNHDRPRQAFSSPHTSRHPPLLADPGQRELRRGDSSRFRSIEAVFQLASPVQLPSRYGCPRSVSSTWVGCLIRHGCYGRCGVRRPSTPMSHRHIASLGLRLGALAAM